MADEVSIRVFGDEFFSRKIRKMQWRAMDMRPVMHDIGQDFLQIVEEQFGTEGGRSGHKWAELEFTTISKRGSAHPILVDSGEMLVEVTDETALHVSHDSIELKIPESVRQKAESAQFGFHTRDSGSRESTVRFIEPRKIIDFTERDRAGFRRKLTDYLVRGDRHQ